MANNLNDAFIQDDSDDESQYIIKIDDVTKYPNYNINTLQTNVVYFEVLRNNDGSYFYINNPFKPLNKQSKIVYENKYGDDLKMNIRDSNTIFVKAYDIYKDNYIKTNHKETDFLSIPGKDEAYTDFDSDSDFDGGRKKQKKSLKKFHFSSTQKYQHGGKKNVRNVTIKNGKGYKKVIYYKNGKLLDSVKKPLKSLEISMIQMKKFIPGLFGDCGCGKKKKNTRKKNH